MLKHFLWSSPQSTCKYIFPFKRVTFRRGWFEKLHVFASSIHYRTSIVCLHSYILPRVDLIGSKATKWKQDKKDFSLFLASAGNWTQDLSVLSILSHLTPWSWLGQCFMSHKHKNNEQVIGIMKMIFFRATNCVHYPSSKYSKDSKSGQVWYSDHHWESVLKVWFSGKSENLHSQELFLEIEEC